MKSAREKECQLQKNDENKKQEWDASCQTGWSKTRREKFDGSENGNMEMLNDHRNAEEEQIKYNRKDFWFGQF